MPDRALDDESGTELPDLSTLPVEELLASDESAFATALRRVVAAAENTGESYAAHGSSPAA